MAKRTGKQSKSRGRATAIQPARSEDVAKAVRNSWGRHKELYKELRKR